VVVHTCVRLALQYGQQKVLFCRDFVYAPGRIRTSDPRTDLFTKTPIATCVQAVQGYGSNNFQPDKIRRLLPFWTTGSLTSRSNYDIRALCRAVARNRSRWSDAQCAPRVRRMFARRSWRAPQTTRATPREASFRSIWLRFAGRTASRMTAVHARDAPNLHGGGGGRRFESVRGVSEKPRKIRVSVASCVNVVVVVRDRDGPAGEHRLSRSNCVTRRERRGSGRAPPGGGTRSDRCQPTSARARGPA
jgi:hypothetical protein